MKIKLGDPAVEDLFVTLDGAVIGHLLEADEDLFVTLDGAVIGHLLEADEEAGFVIQQLPQQFPVRLDGTVVIHHPSAHVEG